MSTCIASSHTMSFVLRVTQAAGNERKRKIDVVTAAAAAAAVRLNDKKRKISWILGSFLPQWMPAPDIVLCAHNPLHFLCSGSSASCELIELHKVIAVVPVCDCTVNVVYHSWWLTHSTVVRAMARKDLMLLLHSMQTREQKMPVAFHFFSRLTWWRIQFSIV